MDVPKIPIKDAKPCSHRVWAAGARISAANSFLNIGSG